jgi:hypothetical protein
MYGSKRTVFINHGNSIQGIHNMAKNNTVEDIHSRNTTLGGVTKHFHCHLSCEIFRDILSTYSNIKSPTICINQGMS